MKNPLPEVDKIVLGLIFGIIIPIVMHALFQLFAERTGFKLSESFTDILAIGCNLPFFYFYLNRGLYKTVQGIVLASVLFAVIYIYMYFSTIISQR